MNPILSRRASGSAGWLAVLAVAGVLIGCGGDEGDASTAASEEGSRSVKGMKFTYVGGQVGDPNYKAVGCGAKARAVELGAVFDQQDAESFAPTDQIPVLRSVAARKPDGILISPTDPNALYAPIKVINERIPVQTVINSLSNTDSINGQILVDNYGGGQAAADYLAELADGKKVKVGVFTFQAGGSKAADDEWKGFEAQVEKYPNLEYIGPQFQGPTSQISDAASKMNALLAAHPDLFGMFATYGFAGQGVLTSVRQRDADVHVVSAYSATTPELVSALRSGRLSAIVDYPFREAGAAAIDQLAAKLTGEPVEPTVSFPSVVYTQKSFGDPAQAKNLGPATC
jgi:ribose transport system substrate-binding protein